MKTPLPEIVEALRTITQLDGLSEAEYTWLAEHGTERRGDTGALLFREKEPACHMSVLLAGEIHVRRQHSGPMAFFIGRAGQITGLLPFSRMKGYGGDGFANAPLWVLDIHRDLFPDMLAAIPSMGQRCVTILLDRVREVTRMEQQAEKLDALGKLAANLAHELNNPASAAQRSAASLFTELRAYGDRKFQLGATAGIDQQCERMMTWMNRARLSLAEYRAHDQALGVLATADREAEITTWLEAHNIPEAWTMAPELSEVGLPMSMLDDFALNFSQEIMAPALAAFSSALRVERMAETIVGSTVRIFDLISAIKDYSYMDQALIQDVDLAQSLENTLTMFGARLSSGHIRVQTDFDCTLPPISAYGRELNQVWTVLIENALDAMGSMGGELMLQTRLAGQMAVVEVWDHGVGILPELQNRVFEPFYTTKAPGSGLGLGLDTAQRIVSRHRGFITVQSKPGETCFQVRLPLDQAEAY